MQIINYMLLTVVECHSNYDNVYPQIEDTLYGISQITQFPSQIQEVIIGLYWYSEV